MFTLLHIKGTHSALKKNFTIPESKIPQRNRLFCYICLEVKCLCGARNTMNVFNNNNNNNNNGLFASQGDNHMT